MHIMNILASRRINLEPLVTHWFMLDDVEHAYVLFPNQRNGAVKVAITPGSTTRSGRDRMPPSFGAVATCSAYRRQSIAAIAAPEL
jgi:hypothetical protein